MIIADGSPPEASPVVPAPAPAPTPVINDRRSKVSVLSPNDEGPNFIADIEVGSVGFLKKLVIAELDADGLLSVGEARLGITIDPLRKGMPAAATLPISPVLVWVSEESDELISDDFFAARATLFAERTGLFKAAAVLGLLLPLPLLPLARQFHTKPIASSCWILSCVILLGWL